MERVVVDEDKEYVKAAWSFQNSEDDQVVFISADVVYLTGATKEQQRIKLSVARDEHDVNYSVKIIETPVDICRTPEGVRTNFFQKALLENYYITNNSNSKHSCPFPKNYHYVMKNLTVTDRFLPPTLTKVRFQVENKILGLVKGKRGWVYFYKYTFYGQYKK